jgi:hypothetical protein
MYLVYKLLKSMLVALDPTEVRIWTRAKLTNADPTDPSSEISL